MSTFVVTFGFGLSPGSVQYIPTLGFLSGTAPPGTGPPLFGDTRTLAFTSDSTQSLALRTEETNTLHMVFQHSATRQFRDE